MNPYDPHYNARPDRHVQNLSVTFARRVRQFCIKRQTSIAMDRSPLVQLYRSATSVAANIRESQFAESTKDFVHKLKIAEKELAEYHFWIGLLMDEPSIAKPCELEEIHSLSLQLQKLLRSIILAKRSNS